jgi:hypothetical protein
VIRSAWRCSRGDMFPRLHDIIREILDWLDRYLGPVTPA